MLFAYHKSINSRNNLSQNVFASKLNIYNFIEYSGKKCGRDIEYWPRLLLSFRPKLINQTSRS